MEHMRKAIRSELHKELLKHGFNEKGASQHETIVLDNDYLDGIALGDLLVLMVQRREKFAHAADGMGDKAAKQNYDDAEAAVEAIKHVINKHTD